MRQFIETSQEMQITKMLENISSVQACNGYCLHLTFEDGVQGNVDIYHEPAAQNLCYNARSGA